MTLPNWLDWARRLQSIAQSGAYYARQFDHPFDLERYAQIERIAAEIIAASEPGRIDALAHIENLFAAQAGHATPKIDVRGVVFHDDKILLVQEKLDGDRWTLPGGWADVGESAAESTVREVWEESGYRVRAAKLIALYNRDDVRHGHPPFVFHAYKAFFRCQLVSDQRDIDPNNIETGEIGWFAEPDITGLDLSIGRVTAAQIARFFEHRRQPDLPTEYD
jgi:8-oxo-dGTP pyrophosphatase MutT (NUDIX family)